MKVISRLKTVSFRKGGFMYNLDIEKWLGEFKDFENKSLKEVKDLFYSFCEDIEGVHDQIWFKVDGCNYANQVEYESNFIDWFLNDDEELNEFKIAYNEDKKEALNKLANSFKEYAENDYMVFKKFCLEEALKNYEGY